MQLELKQLNKRLGITFIYVTHDQEEALTMSDRIALMRNGRSSIEWTAEMYEEPVSRYVADFIGETNLLQSTTARRLGGSVARLTIGGREFEATATKSWEEGKPAWLAVRPEHVYAVASGDGSHWLPVRVVYVIFTAVMIRVHTTVEGAGSLVLHWPAEQPTPEPGAALTVTWPVERGRCVGD